MKLQTLLESSMSDSALCSLAKKLGASLYSNKSFGSSGFIFPKNPSVEIMSFKQFGPTYGTMQTSFKPSSKEITDKSDQRVNKSKDTDIDGKLYVIDSEIGVIIVSDQETKNSRDAEHENKWKLRVEKVHGKPVDFEETKLNIVAKKDAKIVGVYEFDNPITMKIGGSVFPKD